MKRNKSGSPSGDDDDKVHELVDIIAEEVSDVDRAANRRTYLIVKREDGLGPELVECEDGELSILDDAAEDGDLLFFDKADDGKESPEPSGKQALVLSPRAKQLLLHHTGLALEALTVLVTSIKDAEEREGATVPPAVPQGIRRVCEVLAGLLGRTTTSKAGAKMASQRRRQLESAIALLQKLLTEVMPQLEGVSAHKAATDGEDKPASTDAPESALQGEEAQLAEMLATVTKGIGALAERLKKQEATIAKLAKATGLPASREVETVRAPTRPQAEDWPMDMNAPVSRDRVPKEISFFDD